MRAEIHPITERNDSIELEDREQNINYEDFTPRSSSSETLSILPHSSYTDDWYDNMDNVTVASDDQNDWLYSSSAHEFFEANQIREISNRSDVDIENSPPREEVFL